MSVLFVNPPDLCVSIFENARIFSTYPYFVFYKIVSNSSASTARIYGAFIFCLRPCYIPHVREFVNTKHNSINCI